MCDGEPCPQRSTIAAIKDEKVFRMPDTKGAHEAVPQVFARPRGPKPLAFETEERNFVDRIDHSQPSVEFQTIDDPDRIAEANVFGA
jgi:hypothetical protein